MTSWHRPAHKTLEDAKALGLISDGYADPVEAVKGAKTWWCWLYLFVQRKGIGNRQAISG